MCQQMARDSWEHIQTHKTICHKTIYHKYIYTNKCIVLGLEGNDY